MSELMIRHGEWVVVCDGAKALVLENAGDAKQTDERDDQPVKCLDDGGRDETVPLKKILKVEHSSFSPASRI